jgi:hypothetical protein
MAAAGHPITLYSLRTRGKPAAWNKLFENSMTEFVCFADADIIAEPDSVRLLVEKLIARPTITAVAARPRAIRVAGFNIRTLLAPPDRAIRGLNGRLYCTRKSSLRRIFQENGIDGMPEAIISEDAWLTLIACPFDWVEEPKAAVNYIPPTLPDLFRLMRRQTRGALQLQRRGPIVNDLILNDGRPAPRRLPLLRPLLWLTREAAGDGLMPTFRLIVGFVGRKVIHVAALICVALERPRRGLDGWEIANSTKELPVECRGKCRPATEIRADPSSWHRSAD